MQGARSIRSGALVEIAWVLVQQRRQNSPTDQNVGSAVRVGSTDPLAITLCALNVAGRGRCLVDPCNEGGGADGDGICRGLDGQLVLQLRRKRSKVRIIDHIKVGEYPEGSLRL